VSYHGTIDPERILPAVILRGFSQGLRGLLLVVFLAASLTTFASTINRATGFFTRDLYQAYLRRRAGNAELIYASWTFGVAVVAVSMVLALTVENINDIWDWIIMGLGGGLLIPRVLRMYWWRFNGAGYAIGMAVGLLGSIAQRAVLPDLYVVYKLLVTVGFGVLGSVVGTYLTRPTDRAILENFYRTTRPFGFWGPLARLLAPEAAAAMRREHRNDILAVPFALGWQVTLFLLPMQAVVQTWSAFGVTLCIFVACLGGLYVFWYRNLPPREPAQP
jgi:Na+/proline symporter